MSIRTKALLKQYSVRIKTVLQRIPTEVFPKKEAIIIRQARDFYQDMLDLDDTGFTYVGWLTALEKFLKYQDALSLDPDDKLENLANQIMTSSDLIDYFKEYIDIGEAFDRLQLHLFIKRADELIHKL